MKVGSALKSGQVLLRAGNPKQHRMSWQMAIEAEDARTCGGGDRADERPRGPEQVDAERV